MKENLLVLNRNIESEDIDSIALAIKKYQLHQKINLMS
jgi:hypothetical protein